MNIRLRILEIARGKSLSIRQLALKSGVRRQSIMAFLAGANLSIDNLQKILKALGFELNVAAYYDSAGDPITKARFPIGARNLAGICRTYGIKRLALFGSVLGQDFKADSDIDIMVEFKKPVSFFTLDEIRDKLEKTAKCERKVDLVTVGSLSPYIKDEVLSNCEVLYEEAA